MNESIRAVLEHKGHYIETVPHYTTVLDAVERMNEVRIGALVVVEGDRVVGIFTERDVLTRVIAGRLEPATTLVSDVMTRDLLTISADASVTEAMVQVTDKRCRHLPVFDGPRLVGLVSIGDLTSWVVRDQERTITDLNDYVRRG